MAETIRDTHPWLTFALDTSRFSHRLWMALGEARSKVEHIAGVPLAPDVANQMLRLDLIKGALATTAIEGNTLSEDEAERIYDGTLKLPESQRYLADELLNIVDATNTLTARLAGGGSGEITVDLLKELNRMVLRNLELPEGVVPGERREHGVTVGRYRAPPVGDCDALLERLCAELNAFPCPAEHPHQFCIIKAVFAHLYFVWIHPFGDGNGRTARLLELFILLAAGFPQPTGHLLSNHYNRTRARYYDRLAAAVRGQDEVIAFVEYSVVGLVDGLREQVAEIRGHQWSVAWTNYVHAEFHERNSKTDVRRKHLLLALSKFPGGYPAAKIGDISTDIVREYVGKTAKTLARDLNALADLDLIVREPGGVVRAKRETILAFASWRKLDGLVGGPIWPVARAAQAA